MKSREWLPWPSTAAAALCRVAALLLLAASTAVAQVAQVVDFPPLASAPLSFLPYGTGDASVVFRHSLATDPDGTGGLVAEAFGAGGGPEHHPVKGMRGASPGGTVPAGYYLSGFAPATLASLDQAGQVSFEISTRYFTEAASYGGGSDGDSLASQVTPVHFAHAQAPGSGQIYLLRRAPGPGGVARITAQGASYAEASQRSFLGWQDRNAAGHAGSFNSFGKPADGFTRVNAGWYTDPVLGRIIVLAIDGVVVQWAPRSDTANPFTHLTLGAVGSWFQSQFITFAEPLNRPEHWLRNLQISTRSPAVPETATGALRDIAILTDSIIPANDWFDIGWRDINVDARIIRALESRMLRPATLYRMHAGAHTLTAGIGAPSFTAGNPASQMVSAGTTSVDVRGQVKARNPTAVIINGGSNDVGYPAATVENFRAALRDHVEYFCGLDGTAHGGVDYSASPPAVIPSYVFFTNIWDRGYNWNDGISASGTLDGTNYVSDVSAPEAFADGDLVGAYSHAGLHIPAGTTVVSGGGTPYLELSQPAVGSGPVFLYKISPVPDGVVRQKAAAFRAEIQALPGWFASAFPGSSCQVRVIDVFGATGGTSYIPGKIKPDGVHPDYYGIFHGNEAIARALLETFPAVRRIDSDPLELAATASSGLPVSFSAGPPGVCTVAGSTLTLTGPGECTVTAGQAGDGTYGPAPSVSRVLSVVLIPQAIDFAALADRQVDSGPVTLAATASSGLAVSYSAAPAAVCTVTGSTVTLVGAGTCSVTAEQAGDATYAPAAPETRAFAVNPAPQTIDFAPLADRRIDSGPVTLAATASSDLAVSFSAVPAGVCTVAANEVALVAPGECTVTAGQPGDAVYAPAPPVVRTFTITPAPLAQTIDFPALADQLLSAGSLTLVATATSGLAVSYTSDPAAVCIVSGNTVTLVGAGTCSVTAAQAGDVVYEPAVAVTRTFGVLLTPQTIDFPAVADRRADGGPVTLAATASSGLAVSYSAGPVAVCTVAGLEVTLVATGECTVTAEQAGNTTYAPALPVSRTFTITPALLAQSIDFPVLADQLLSAATVTLGATASSGLAVTYTTDPAAVCTVSGNTVTLVGAGTCSVTAEQAGDATYEPAPAVTRTFAVSLTAQTIDFPTVPDRRIDSGPVSLAATASSGLAVSYSAGPAAVCTVAGNEVTLVAPGECTVTAEQAGDASYAAALPVARMFTITPALLPQTIDFTAPGDQLLSLGSITLVATATSGLPVTYTTDPAAVCTVSGSTVTLVAAGSCSVTAEQAGDATYEPAVAVTRTFAVLLDPQTIDFAPLADRRLDSGPLTLAATASSGLAVSYSAGPAVVCSVAGNELTLVGAGECTVTAEQAGDATYAPAQPVSRIFTVTPALLAQTIDFPALADQLLSAGTVNLGATASSGLAVTYSSDPAGVCTVSGNTVTLMGTGTCSVTAGQPGDATYEPAVAVTRTFAVLLDPQTIDFAPLADRRIDSGPLTLAATASSGLPVSYSAGPAAVCSVAGNELTLVAPGECTVTAEQAGDATYTPAVPVTRTFTITPALLPQTIDFPAPGDQLLSLGSITLMATASSGLPVTYTADPAAVCTISGSTVTLVGAGTCSVTAGQSGDGTYEPAAAVTRSFAVLLDPQTIEFAPLADRRVDSGPVTLAAMASSGLAVSYSAGPAVVCSVAANELTLLGSGECTVTAEQGGNAIYAAALPVTRTFTITPALLPQTIDFPALPDQLLSAGTVSLGATASSGLPVTYTTDPAAVCTVSGSTVTLVGAGTCSVTAAQDGDATYAAAAAVTRNFAVNLTPQTIDFAPLADRRVDSGPVSLAATASSGLAVSYSAGPAMVCSVAGNELTLVGAGECTVTAEQPGDAIYAPALPVSRTFTITPALLAQTIDFPAVPDQPLSAGTVSLGATATSGLPVTYASDPAGVCTVIDSTVTLVGAGTCSVTAEQPGDATHAPAQAVTRTFAVNLTPQTIDFAPLADRRVDSGPVTLAATASSGLPVSYSAGPAAICTVSGDEVTLVGAGACTVTAEQAGDATYAPAPPVSQTFTITPALLPQTIDFPALADHLLSAGTVDLGATASSGLPVTYTTDPAAVCTVSGSTVTLVGAGTCSVTADQPGDATYEPAAPVTRTFAVLLDPQTIDFAPLSERRVDSGPLTLAATASSGLTVSYSAGPVAVCSVAGNELTLVGAGECTVTAEQPGDATYAPALPVSRTFAVTPALLAQTIDFPVVADQLLSAGSLTLVATATSGLPVSYTSEPAAVCTVSGSTVTLVAAGSCSVTAEQAGDETYAPAAPATRVFAVNLAPQTIDFAPLPERRVDTGPVTLAATASSGLAVSYSAGPAAVCTVAGNEVTLVAPGECTVTAEQGGNTTYAPALPVSRTFTITPALLPQTIDFPALADQLLSAGTVALAATASSGLAVTYTTDPAAVCTVSGSTVTLVGAGTCSVTVDQAGDATYEPAVAVTRTFAVLLDPQTIDFAPLPERRIDSGPLTLAATASSGLAVSYSAGPVAVCTVAGTEVTLVATGECTVTAEQAGNTTYAAAPPVSRTFTITPALLAQSIDFAVPADQLLSTGTVTLGATASSGLPVTYTSDPAAVCTVSGNTATLVGAGTCSVTAEQGGDATYEPAVTVTRTFAVLLDPQSIDFAPLADRRADSGPVTLAATASSGLVVSYSAGPAAVCSVAGNELTLVGSGECTVTAEQAGNATYSPAVPVSRTFTITPALLPQAIDFPVVPDQPLSAGTVSLGATASSGLPVTYTSDAGAVCAVSGSTATLVDVGTCSVTAAQAGDATYEPAPPVTRTFTVSLTAQTIDFAPLADRRVDSGPVSLAATASSGLPVSYSAGPAAVCSATGNEVALVAPGECTVTADQAGDATYAPALPVSRTFTIAPALVPQTIDFPVVADQLLSAGTATLAATASSGLPVSYTSDPAAVCTVSGNTVTLAGPGTCSVTAEQGGDATYEPAPAVTRTFAVSLTAQTIDFAPLADRRVDSGPVSLAATASSGLAVSYSAGPAGVCTVAGNELTLVGVGECAVTAEQAGDATYAPAVPVTRTFTITPAFLPQTIDFPALPDQLLSAGTATLVATASSGLPVSYTSDPAAVCTVSGSTVTLVGAGTCSVTADQAGDTTYEPAVPVTRNFAVLLDPQSIDFAPLPERRVDSGPVTLAATASSGLAVSYSAGPAAVCNVAGNELTLVGAGECTVTAEQAGDATYAPALPVSRIFTITPALLAQTIDFPAVPDQLLSVGTVALVATASSGLPVTYTSEPAAVCTVSGSTVTLAGAGTCSVTAAQAGDATYEPAPAVTRTFAVDLTPQTIDFAPLADRRVDSGPVSLAATASSGLAVSYSAGPAAVCNVTGNEISLVATGECTVTAEQAGDATYAPALPVSRTFTITPALVPQTIDFPAIPDQLLSAGTVTLGATASSGLPVTYVSDPAGVCTASGNTVTLVGAGTCSLTAVQAGDATYEPAVAVTRNFAVLLDPQSIDFAPLGDRRVDSGPLTLGATASSGLAVSYSGGPAAVCTVAGSEVTLVATGECSVTAHQAGDASYAAALPVTRTFTITPALLPQTIDFPALPDQLLSAGTATLVATASSGLPVSYTGEPAAVCTVSDGTVTLVAVGTCSVTAGQAGDATYAPAAPVTRAFAVLEPADTAPPVITALSVATGTDMTAVVSWQTDEPAAGRLEILAPGPATFQDALPRTSHVFTLTGLAPGATYSYRVTATDAALNAASLPAAAAPPAVFTMPFPPVGDAPLVAFPLDPATAAGQAAYRENIGFTRLQQELGAALPDGSGVPVGQVEPATTGAPPAWMPDDLDGEFAGKTITGAPGAGASSPGATATARDFYGLAGSIAPGITDIRVWAAASWLGGGALQTVPTGPGPAPDPAATRVTSHAWVGTASEYDPAALARLDWLVSADEAIQVVAADNGDGQTANNLGLLASAWNVIVAGRSDGLHLLSSAPVDGTFTGGRTRPDLVDPADSTVRATPHVAAAAALLVQAGHADPALSRDPVAPSATNRAGQVVWNAERAVVVKAALMAGASRATHNRDVANLDGYRVDPANRTANGLDRRYGAGQLNVRNSHRIITGGEQDSQEDGGAAVVALAGFDYDPHFGGQAGSNATATYPLPVAGQAQVLTGTLAWNLAIAGPTPGGFDAAATLHDLTLELVDLDNGGAVVATSASPGENTENLWVVVPANQRYALRVTGVGSFEANYGLAWQVLPDADADRVPDETDNCSLVANANQCDSDRDGFGNRCDGDLNNNGPTNAQDTVLFRARLGGTSQAPGFDAADLNCSGAINAQDSVIFRSLLGSPAGPSGLNP